MSSNTNDLNNSSDSGTSTSGSSSSNSNNNNNSNNNLGNLGTARPSSSGTSPSPSTSSSSSAGAGSSTSGPSISSPVSPSPQPEPQPEMPSNDIGSNALYVWSCLKENDSLAAQRGRAQGGQECLENLLFLPTSLMVDTFPNDFCDFVFPVLIGFPENVPLEKHWIDKVPQLFKPGCYLVCATVPLHPSDQDISVLVYQTTTTVDIRRLNADLYFMMFSANALDKIFSVSTYVHQIDDLERVKGYFYPNQLEHDMQRIVIQHSTTRLGGGGGAGGRLPTDTTDETCNANFDLMMDELALMKQTKTKRVVKRYTDLISLHSKFKSDLQHLNKSFVSQKPTNEREFLSERFNFFLSQDCYAMIMDHNSQVQTANNTGSGPYLRLIRPGAYVSIEGTPRYANLSQAATTYLTRYIFLCRLTSYPLIIIQEGVKAFDVYYNNDGLDFTYIDIAHPANLIHVDWYQLQVDLKLDHQERQFKGHIMRCDELSDILKTFRSSQLEYDIDLASRVTLLDLNDLFEGQSQVESKNGGVYQEESQIFIFNLQQVVYNYINQLCGQLEVIWNLYFKIESEHLTNCPSSSSGSTAPIYLYIKSFTCIYYWSTKTPHSPATEQIGVQVTLSDLDISQIDLAKVGWSRQEFDQLLILYLWKMFPYQNSIKQLLLNETRKIIQKREFFLRPTTLADKLVYRNGYYNSRAYATSKRPQILTQEEGGGAVPKSLSNQRMFQANIHRNI